jgi:hypothetical protein
MPAQEKAMVEYRQTTAIALLISQIILIILYAALVEYGEGPKASSIANSDVDTFYPFYQDVHVMIFIGFGFLMTFLKKYVITMFLSIFVNKTSQAYNSYRIFNCLFFQFAMVRNGQTYKFHLQPFFLVLNSFRISFCTIVFYHTDMGFLPSDSIFSFHV